MKKLSFYFRVVLGACLLLNTGLLCILFLRSAFEDANQRATFGDRFQSVVGCLLFASMGFAVWRILLFRRDRTTTAGGSVGGESVPPTGGSSPAAPLAPVPRPSGDPPPTLSAGALAERDV